MKHRGFTAIAFLALLFAIFWVISPRFGPASATLQETTTPPPLPGLPVRIDPRILGQEPGQYFSPGVHNSSSAQYKLLAVANAIRGPASGLIADFYDWQNPLGLLATGTRRVTPRPPTFTPTQTPTLTKTPTVLPTSTPTRTPTPPQVMLSGYVMGYQQTEGEAESWFPINGVPVELKGEYLLTGALSGEASVSPQGDVTAYDYLLHLYPQANDGSITISNIIALGASSQASIPYMIKIKPGSYLAYLEVKWAEDSILYSDAIQFAVSGAETTTVKWDAYRSIPPLVSDREPLPYDNTLGTVIMQEVTTGAGFNYVNPDGYFQFVVPWNGWWPVPGDGASWTRLLLVVGNYGDSQPMSAGPASPPGYVVDTRTIAYPWGLVGGGYAQNDFVLKVLTAPKATPTPFRSLPESATITPIPCTPQPGEFVNSLGMLDFLRLARGVNGDENLGLTTIVNLRGIPDYFCWLPFHGSIPTPHPENCRTYNHYVHNDLDFLKTLAADWILYTHYTIQEFDASNPPSLSSSDPLERRSAEILNAIHWQSCDGSYIGDELPDPGETLPELIYWEIGNDPDLIMDGVSFGPDRSYIERYGGVIDGVAYVGLTNAMISKDIEIHGEKTIKVGPSLIPGSMGDYLDALNIADAEVDFVSYHPYTEIFGAWVSGYYTATFDRGTGHEFPFSANEWFTDTEGVDFLQTQISGIFAQQRGWRDAVRSIYHETNDPETNVELLVTEWNPASWPSTFYLKCRGESMAHALASMETIFAFARLGVSQAYYFTDPTFGNDAGNPTYTTFKFLKEYLGTALLQTFPANVDDFLYYKYRGYVTRNTRSTPDYTGPEIVFWGLNWGDDDVELEFQIDAACGYETEGYYKLEAPTLLHGALDGDPDAPGSPTIPYPLTVPLAQTFISSYHRWDTGQITLTAPVPKNSWVAYIIRRDPAAICYDTSLPLIFEAGAGGQNAPQGNNPYPPPGATATPPVITATPPPYP